MSHSIIVMIDAQLLLDRLFHRVYFHRLPARSSRDATLDTVM